MQISEFFVRLGFKVEEAQLKKAFARINDFKETLQTLATTAVATTLSVLGLTQSVANDAAEIQKLSTVMGVSSEEASKWGYVAKRAGLDVNDFTELAAELAENLGEASEGTGEAADAFKSLGINVKDSNGKVRETGDVLIELAGKWHALSDGQKKTASALGIFGDEGLKLLGTLNLGSEAIEAMKKEAQDLGVVLSADTIKAAATTSKNFKTLQAILGAVKNTVGSALLPVVNQVTDSFIKWWKANKDIVKTRIEVFVKAFTKVVKVLGSLLWEAYRATSAVVKTFLWLLEAIMPLNYWLAAIGVVLTGLAAQWLVLGVVAVATAIRAGAAWAIANAPLLLMAAAIGLVLLILEDLYGWITGKDSLIGRVFSSWHDKWKKFVADLNYDNPGDPWFLRVIKNAVREVRELIGYLREVSDWAGDKYDAVAGVLSDIDSAGQSFVDDKLTPVVNFFGIESKKQRDAKASKPMTAEEQEVLLGLLSGAASYATSKLSPNSSSINNTSKVIQDNRKAEIRIEVPNAINLRQALNESKDWLSEHFGFEATAIEESR